MKRPRLTRASTLAPFVNFLYDVGAPVDRELQRRRLPVSLDLPYHAGIPVESAINFTRSMERDQGIDDLVYRVMSQGDGSESASHSAAYSIAWPFSSLTVRGRLCQFFDFLERINPDIACSIVDLGDRAMVVISLDEYWRRNTGHHYDWTLVLQVISIFRSVLGHHWNPDRIEFCMNFTPSELALERYADVEFRFDAPETAIVVDPRDLHRSVPPRSIPEDTDVLPPPEEIGADPLSALGFALRAYLADGYPDIRFAADLSGMTVRSLQRLLAKHDQTYSGLISHLRMQLACELIVEPKRSITDVANAVGYDDPSHFTRAFRRLTGTTPRQYRAGLA